MKNKGKVITLIIFVSIIILILSTIFLINHFKFKNLNNQQYKLKEITACVSIAEIEFENRCNQKYTHVYCENNRKYSDKKRFKAIDNCLKNFK